MACILLKERKSWLSVVTGNRSEPVQRSRTYRRENHRGDAV
jgi:hypothetical protein